jgi:hypothetical protein
VWQKRAQQRTCDQVALAVQRVDTRLRALARDLAGTDRKQLARVIPFIGSRCDVETFVALQPDQLRAERLRENACQLGLAGTGLALDEQRFRTIELRQGERGVLLAHATAVVIGLPAVQ